MTSQITEFKGKAAQDDAQLRQMRSLLAEMEALLAILPTGDPGPGRSDLPSEDEIEASFDNMPV